MPTDHSPGKRIAAVDIARILAAGAVMLEHTAALGTPISSFIARIPPGIFSAFSNIFFVLAGYFACRNISWKKALDNAWWSFAPFMLWNSITLLVFWLSGKLPTVHTWNTLFGCSAFILPEFSLPLGAAPSEPLNGPLWFMRDLVFLFLLSPLLFKVARILFPLLLLASCLPCCAAWFTHDSFMAVMSPYSLAFFTAGCFLRSLKEEHQRKALEFCNTWLILLGCALNAALTCFLQEAPYYLLHSMASLWLFYQCARWVDLHLPALKRLALVYAPVTFLTFATHMLLYPYLPFRGTNLALLYPVACFLLCALLFFAMKRYARPLLHLVAHYKLRPGDLMPTSPRPHS